MQYTAYILTSTAISKPSAVNTIIGSISVVCTAVVVAFVVLRRLVVLCKVLSEVLIVVEPVEL